MDTQGIALCRRTLELLSVFRIARNLYEMLAYAWVCCVFSGREAAIDWSKAVSELRAALDAISCGLNGGAHVQRLDWIPLENGKRPSADVMYQLSAAVKSIENNLWRYLF